MKGTLEERMCLKTVTATQRTSLSSYFSSNRRKNCADGCWWFPIALEVGGVEGASAPLVVVSGNAVSERCRAASAMLVADAVRVVLFLCFNSLFFAIDNCQ